MPGKWIYKIASKRFPKVEIRVLADSREEALELAKDAEIVMMVDKAFGLWNPKINPVYCYDK